jgi:phosphotriesterase-related protein
MSDAVVWSVLGQVSGNDLGVTLPHEHLFVDLTCYWGLNGAGPGSATEPLEMSKLALTRSNPFLLRDNCLLADWGVAIDEALEYRRLGGGTVVDVTLPEIGRDPRGLRRVAEATGLTVIAGCGHYVHIAHPAGLADESVEAIAERLVAELTEGIGDTGVRPGVIGEIGTSAPIHPDELKVLRAAARAHRVTGAPVTVHLHPGGRTGHDVLDAIAAEGGDLTRVVLGHLDNDLGRTGESFEDELAYHRSLAERGCFIQYDCCGNSAFYPESSYCAAYWLPSDRERVVAIAALVEAGYERQILLSQDVCKKSQLLRYGGVGYGHVLRDFVGYLRAAGLEGLVERFLVENPRRMLVGT